MGRAERFKHLADVLNEDRALCAASSRSKLKDDVISLFVGGVRHPQLQRLVQILLDLELGRKDFGLEQGGFGFVFGLLEHLV